jgi:glycosyltransferase involved in cell wall biosynthesis
MITVVICTYNRADMLDAALASVVAQRISTEIPFEVVVVDDGSTDNTANVMARHSSSSQIQIRYVTQANSGVAAARNRGVAEARGDWIAFFDDDQIADKEWLSRLFGKAEGMDIVGGPCRLMLLQNAAYEIDPTVRRLLGENPYMAREGQKSASGLDPRMREAIPGTGNALVKKSLFQRVGLFREDRSYGEDLEFFRRAEAAGALFSIAPTAVVHHLVPPSRLSTGYLFPLAKKGGASQALIDTSACSYTRALWNALLRAAHLASLTLPRLAIALLRQDRTGILGRRCSVLFALAYIRTVSSLLVERNRTCRA